MNSADNCSPYVIKYRAGQLHDPEQPLGGEAISHLAHRGLAVARSASALRWFVSWLGNPIRCCHESGDPLLCSSFFI